MNFVKRTIQLWIGRFGLQFNVSADYGVSDVFLYRCGGNRTGAISLIMLVARVVDAVTDPMMGVIIDKTHTRWGKARPYVLWMAVPFGIISASMFLVPNFGGTGKFIYALITYILFCIVYTALNIPYSTMLSCMTDDVSDRLSFNMFKSLGASLGGFVVMGATLTLVAVFGQETRKRASSEPWFSMRLWVSSF